MDSRHCTPSQCNYEGETHFSKSLVRSHWWILDITRLVIHKVHIKVKHNPWSSNHQVNREGHGYEGETQFIKSQVESGSWVLDTARLVIKSQGEKSHWLILHISRQVNRDGHNYEGETQVTKPKIKIRCTAHVVLCRRICGFPGQKRIVKKWCWVNREESNVLLPFHDYSQMVDYSVALRWGGGLLKRKKEEKQSPLLKRNADANRVTFFYFVCHDWFATCPQRALFCPGTTFAVTWLVVQEPVTN